MPKLIRTDHKLNWSFYCPGCKCHHGVSTIPPGPIWNWNDDLERPTFSPSILVTMGPEPDPITHLAPKDAPRRRCHSFVTDGRIFYLSDSTHELAGKEIEMIEIGSE